MIFLNFKSIKKNIGLFAEDNITINLVPELKLANYILKIDSKVDADNVFYSQALIGDKIFANNHLFASDGSYTKTKIKQYSYNSLSVDGNKLYYIDYAKGDVFGIYDFKRKKNKLVDSKTQDIVVFQKRIFFYYNWLYFESRFKFPTDVVKVVDHSSYDLFYFHIARNRQE